MFHFEKFGPLVKNHSRHQVGTLEPSSGQSVTNSLPQLCGTLCFQVPLQFDVMSTGKYQYTLVLNTGRNNNSPLKRE